MMTGVSRAGFASPVLLVHGGAWDIPADQLEAHTRGVAHAAQAGYDLLRQGASSLDAVEAAVPSSKTTRPSMPAGEAFSPVTAGCSSMRC